MKGNGKPWAFILPAAGDGSHLAATRDQDWTGILPFGHSPCFLPLRPACRFYFPLLLTALSCCHRQISDCLVCYCSTHRGKMSLLAGVWVPEQINRKEKMVPAVGWQGREKGGEADDGEVCHWLSIWGNSTLLISPFILFPSCPALYPNPHAPVHQWARKGVVVAGKVSIPRVKGWSRLFYVCSFHAGFRCSA